MNEILNICRNIVDVLRLLLYKRIYQPYLVWRIRKKQKIRVVFVLCDLATWKTESLYCSMLKHERFEPILALTDSLQTPDSHSIIKKYCEFRGYSFVELERGKTVCKQLNPDILVYQKPYGGIYPKEHTFYSNYSSLFVSVLYGFHCHLHLWANNIRLYFYSWQYYFENYEVANQYEMLFPRLKNNIIVTGVPMMDSLMYNDDLDDYWKCSNKKLRIIYAPHHTIGDMHMPGIAFSTFLQNGEFLLSMAKKYHEKIHIAFKPHPLLRGNLEKVWGKEKTDTYYDEWAKLDNTQLENGDYKSLFHYSDCMIHDCSAFTVEYLYTKKPVMFLLRDDNTRENMSCLANSAFEMHYKGRCHEDIELFILNMMQGIDPLKQKRENFYHEKLLPPYGKTASENIINAILGINEFGKK